MDKSKNPGLAKLPTKVRNKMGYMKKGGRVKMKSGGMAKKGRVAKSDKNSHGQKAIKKPGS